MDLSYFGSGGLSDIINGLGNPQAQQQMAPPQQAQQMAPQPDPMQALAASLQQPGFNPGSGLPPITEPTPHGMFGIHGVARDILGALGDAFLVQSGNKPVYAHTIDDEKDSAALKGMTQDPVAAAERLSQTNPNAAQDFYVKSIAAKRLQQTADQTYESNVVDRALRFLGAANSDNYPALVAQAQQYAKAKGVTLPDLPSKYDPDAIHNLMMSSVPVERQMYYGLQGTKIEHQDARADQRNDTTIRGQDIGKDIATGHDRTARDVAAGHDATSADNNYRTTQTSRENNSDTNRTIETVTGIKDRRAERHEALTVTNRGVDHNGDMTVTLKNGTVQTARGLKPITAKGRRNFGGGNAGGGTPSGSRIVDVKTRAEAEALPKGTMFRNPNGQVFTR